jgi:hypothetical protein
MWPVCSTIPSAAKRLSGHSSALPPCSACHALGDFWRDSVNLSDL